MKIRSRSRRQHNRSGPSWFRRLPPGTRSAAAGLLLLGTVVALAESGRATAGDSANAAAGHVNVDPSDPDSLLDARSPGGRGYGWLANTKHRGFAPDAPLTPTERILSSVRRRPPAVPGTGVPPIVQPDGYVGAIPDDGDSTFEPEASPEGLVSGPVGSEPVGFYQPGYAGGFAGTGGGGNPDSNVDVPVAGVPEPMTWAMLIIGFFMVGTGLRRQWLHTQLRGAL